VGCASGLREATTFVAISVLAAGVVGCSSARVDKSGGSQPTKPFVLTLAAHDDDEAYGTYAAAVERLSGGSMRIRVARNWRATGTELDYERGLVDDVRTGKVALGIVGVRVWDTLGVNSFQALVAPFLIDSLEQQGRALRSPLAAQALASLRRDGVVGIALLPGRLRRPFGITRLLVGPADYRRSTIAIRLGRVAEATFDAVGASTKAYVPVDFTGFDGADTDPLTITQNGWDHGVHGLTSNVVFWPKAQTIVMNRKAFGSLTSDQRRILLDAGAAALEPELARIARDQRLGISVLCGEKTFRFATASPAERAALRAAVQPVYDRIERNLLTRRWIAEIARARTAPDVVRCRPG
jgi:TRAP-type C4-dicarboxylate transport system substrate-binding protein